MWCVVQVRQGEEESVRRQCQEKLSSDLVKNCYVFYYEEKKHIRGEWVIQEKPLFPGYVFMVTDEADRLSDELVRIKGKTKLLETADKVVPLSDSEVEFLMTFGGKEQTIEMSEGVIERSKVKIYSGPLVGKKSGTKSERYWIIKSFVSYIFGQIAILIFVSYGNKIVAYDYLKYRCYKDVYYFLNKNIFKMYSNLRI